MKKRWYNYFVVTEGGQPSEAAEPAGAAPAREIAPRRVIDVAPDISSEEPPATGGETAVSDPAAFDEIYTSAQIGVPPHGYSVLKVAEMLQSEHLQSLPVDVKRKSILVALDAAGVKVDDIIRDAVQRDRALDTYEQVLQRQLEATRVEKERENQELETEISERVKELRARIDANNKEISKEQDQMLKWRTRKRLEESRIAEAVGYFVSENPITTSNPAADNKGGSNVR